MITYIWHFSDLMVKPKEGNLENVLYMVQWRLKGIDENGITGEQFGSCSLPDPNPDSFTPYNQLTKPQVETFVETSIGYIVIQSLKKSIQEQIEAQVNPPFVRMDAPWETSAI